MTGGLEAAYRDHERLVWSIGYRMLGTTADADEVLQETFTRALEHPPDQERPLRPWLVKVAANLSRDRLRRRRRQPYDGPWLPSPVDTSGLPPVDWVRAAPPPSPEDRVDLVRTLSYSWLAAAEALTPSQRAVLVLRDVLELDTAETARALAMTEANVKVTLHRARRALATELPVEPGRAAEALGVIARLGAALATGDVEAVKALLADDVVAASDGGGVYHAARRPVVGPDRVARLFLGLLARSPPVRMEPRLLGGQPGLLTWHAHRPGDAPRSALVFEVRGDRVRRIWSVLAPPKLG